MDWAYQELCRIQQVARSGSSVTQPRWPISILRSRHWLNWNQRNGRRTIKGSYRSHQVPATEVKTQQSQLQLLEDWLRAYIEELFDQGHPKLKF